MQMWRAELNLKLCEEFWGHLRQDQGVLRPVVVIQAGLLGVQLIVDDGQLTQALHKRIGFWGEHCRLYSRNRKKQVVIAIFHRFPLVE